jgi:hypothetical protein
VVGTSAWLEQRKESWRRKWNFFDPEKWPRGLLILKRGRVWVYNMNDVPPLPPPVPYISKHPLNGHAWMGDTAKAALRHIQAEIHISTSMVPLALSLFFSVFFRKPAPPTLLMSARSFLLALGRLSERDDELLRDTLTSEPWSLYYLVTDDTHTAVEEHQIQVAAIDPKTGDPRFYLLSVLMGLQKSSESNGIENLKLLDEAGIGSSRLSGSSGDRPSLGEYREMGLNSAGHFSHFPAKATHSLSTTNISPGASGASTRALGTDRTACSFCTRLILFGQSRRSRTAAWRRGS